MEAAALGGTLGVIRAPDKPRLKNILEVVWCKFLRGTGNELTGEVEAGRGALTRGHLVSSGRSTHWPWKGGNRALLTARVRSSPGPPLL